MDRWRNTRNNASELVKKKKAMQYKTMATQSTGSWKGLSRKAKLRTPSTSFNEKIKKESNCMIENIETFFHFD